MRWLASLNHWLHLLSVAIWVGGLGFLIMSFHPAATKTLPGDLLKTLYTELRRRYIRMTGIFLAILLVTGGLNVFFTRALDVPAGSFPKSWMWLFGLKLALVTGLISLYFMNILYRTSDAREDEAGIPWSRPAFILGVLIIFVAAALKFSHN